MLDRKFIIENADQVKKNCADRGLTDIDVDKMLSLYETWKSEKASCDDLRKEANLVSKSIGKAKDAEEREAKKEEGRLLREKVADLEVKVEELEAELNEIHTLIPNMTHPDAPIGKDDKANLQVKSSAAGKPTFDFPVLDHVELGEKLDLIDFESGAKVTGHGFYFLKNEAVLLELALQRYALEILLAEGFTPTITPDLARNEILQGVGFNPRGGERQIYNIEETDLSLVATAEITLGGLYSKEILEKDDFPIKVCGLSHCFRTEAGAHGKASRGLYRVHQFSKVEMFTFTLPEDSDAMLEYLCGLQCKIFDGLGIHYRVVDTATGDLGGPAYRKYDIEAWMPGRGEAGEYGEVTSTSNCTDYQARRLGIKYRPTGEKGTRFAHTLNGTAVALSRGIIAILENYQQADGSIVIPEVLRPWMGKDKIEAK